MVSKANDIIFSEVSPKMVVLKKNKEYFIFEARRVTEILRKYVTSS